ncbi:glycyl-tRNA synthetase subunit alpha [Buchnera aphidicola (Nipponaphis monzeni)]|uniref:Glycine--tRNA ligase alpha subunit n=1 Tax=Buchnera aphidicola (Nipponaphis monzeni) TaxID=2495405 RepID=A0A455T9Y2_9GAMM|nr:glycyl-tRNA synthetase subunit alpha [Buchnera aphidicola (Nipponaphis monzeni)]
MEPLDLPIGAGTFHKETFFNAIKKNTSAAVAYVQPCRRPSDGRYASNPSRLQHYYQFQVIIKPPPENIQKIYINSLKKLLINPKIQDIRFVEDNWENPTLGASGVGWEIRINGMEVTQFTYFQQMGGLDCNPVTVEITYGLERIAMHLQNTKNVYDVIWMKNKRKSITYGDLFYQNEIEQSSFNFTYSNTKMLLKSFKQCIEEATKLLSLNPPLIFPAYEFILQATHNFNLLEAKREMSVNERKHYIFTIRNLVKLLTINYHNK